MSSKNADELYDTIVDAQRKLEALTEEWGDRLPRGQNDMLRNVALGLNNAERSARHFREDLSKPWLFPVTTTEK